MHVCDLVVDSDAGPPHPRRQDDPVQRPDMDTVLVRLRELQREEELHPTDPPPGGLAGCGCVIC